MTASAKGPTPSEECTHKFIELSHYGLDLEADAALFGCRCNKDSPDVPIVSSNPYFPTSLEDRHEDPVSSGISHISDPVLSLFCI